MYDHSSPPRPPYPLYPTPPPYHPLSFSLVSFFFALLSPSPPTFPLRTSFWFIISTALLFLFSLSLSSAHNLLAALRPPNLFSFSRERHHCPLGINRGFSFDVPSSRPLSYFSLFRPPADVHHTRPTTRVEINGRCLDLESSFDPWKERSSNS